MSTTKQSVGAAWKKVITTKNGETEILNIVIGDQKFTAFINSYKQEGDKAPDYKIYVDDYKSENKQAPKPAAPAAAKFAGQDLPF